MGIQYKLFGMVVSTVLLICSKNTYAFDFNWLENVFINIVLIEYFDMKHLHNSIYIKYSTVLNRVCGGRGWELE